MTEQAQPPAQEPPDQPLTESRDEEMQRRVEEDEEAELDEARVEGGSGSD